MIFLALVMGVAETGWALACAVTGANLFLFYGVLILASTVFFVPGFGERRGRAT